MKEKESQHNSPQIKLPWTVYENYKIEDKKCSINKKQQQTQNTNFFNFWF